MDGLVVVNIFLLVLFLLLDCFLLHVIQAHDGVHQFVYGDGMVVRVLARVGVITKRFLGWRHLGWGHMVVVEVGHLVGIFSIGVFPFGITLGWIL